MAGRQRMLTQRMSKEFFLISKDFETESNRAKLAASIDLFQSSLVKLINGSAADSIPAAPSEFSYIELNRVMELWKPFKAVLEDNMNRVPVPPESADFILANNIPLHDQANIAVGRLVDAARASGVPTAGLQVDMAGRQRTLSQRMAKEVVMISLGKEVTATLASLADTMELFGDSHSGLLRGMRFLDLPETRNFCVLQQMRTVSEYWRKFEPLIRQISYDGQVTLPMIGQVSEMSTLLLREMNAAVNLYVEKPSVCPLAISQGDWSRALRESALGQQYIWQCGRLFMQIANDVDTGGSRTKLTYLYSRVESSLRAVIEGSVTEMIPSPVSQEIADTSVDAWTDWVRFRTNLEASLTKSPLVSSDISRTLSYAIAVFRKVQQGFNRYVAAAAVAEPSLAVGSIRLAARLSELVEEVLFYADYGVYRGDIPTYAGYVMRAVANFDTALGDLLRGRRASSSDPTAISANRTSDACVLRHMQKLNDRWGPLAQTARRFATTNASNATLLEMGMKVVGLEDYLRQALDLYALGSAGACDLRTSDREWESLIAGAGRLSALCSRASTELVLQSRGVRAPWGGAGGRWASALSDVRVALERLTFGNTSVGLTSPPTQAIADHILQFTDDWALFVQGASSSSGRRMAAAGTAPLATVAALVDLYGQSATAVGSSVPVARLLLAGKQPTIIERLVRQAAGLQPGSSAEEVDALRQGLREFEAAHHLLLHGSPPTTSPNHSSYVPQTTERPIIPQMQKVMEAFERLFKPKVEAVARASFASESDLSSLAVGAAALAVEADKAAELYGKASTLADLLPARILAPIPLTGTGWRPGSVMKVAASLAQDIINEQQALLPGISLETVFIDDRCTAEDGMRAVLDRISKDNEWVGLGGMACSDVCESTAIVASSVRMPVVSYACAGSHHPDQAYSQGFVRMGTALDGAPQIILDLAAKFGWRRLRILSDNTRENLEDSAALAEAVTPSLIVDWKSFSPTNSLEVSNAMQFLQEGRYRQVFLMGDEYFCRRVVCAAKAQGITKGMTWIASGIKNRDWYRENDPVLLTEDPDCTGAVIAEHLQGALNIAGAGMPHEELADQPLECMPGHTPRSFKTLVEQRFASEAASGSEFYDGVLGPAADGVCVLAYTVRHMIRQGYTLHDLQRPGEAVYQEMISYIQDSLAFFGVSGNVSFTGMDRPGSLAVRQIQGNASVMVGFRDANGTVSLVANGGPSSASWAPHPPDPPAAEFPMLPLIVALVAFLVLSTICLGVAHGIRASRAAQVKAAAKVEAPVAKEV